MIDVATGKEILQNTKTGKQLYNVTIDEMDAGKVSALRKTLQTKYKAKPEHLEERKTSARRELLKSQTRYQSLKPMRQILCVAGLVFSLYTGGYFSNFFIQNGL